MRYGASEPERGHGCQCQENKRFLAPFFRIRGLTFFGAKGTAGPACATLITLIFAGLTANVGVSGFCDVFAPGAVAAVVFGWDKRMIAPELLGAIKTTWVTNLGHRSCGSHISKGAYDSNGAADVKSGPSSSLPCCV
jgi:hypothetical protein